MAQIKQYHPIHIVHLMIRKIKKYECVHKLKAKNKRRVVKFTPLIAKEFQNNVLWSNG